MGNIWYVHLQKIYGSLHLHKAVVNLILVTMTIVTTILTFTRKETGLITQSLATISPHAKNCKQTKALSLSCREYGKVRALKKCGVALGSTVQLHILETCLDPPEIQCHTSQGGPAILYWECHGFDSSSNGFLEPISLVGQAFSLDYNKWQFC